MRSQRTSKTSGGPLTGCSKPTTKYQILNAEFLQAPNMVDRNHLFFSANGDSYRFKKMFRDLQIAAKYSQGETKPKYVVQFGLAPFVKDELITDVQKTPYSCKFDKTTNSQLKKQYDGYVSFFSKKLRKIVTLYCGTLFVGHCMADNLVDIFFEFVRDLGLDFNLLLALGINGPNVNKSFKSKLAEELQKRSATHGYWYMYYSHSKQTFEGIKCLKGYVNVDQFAIDLHFFFKLSATRREDYRGVSKLTDVTTHYVIKHCQNCWLSLDKVLVKITEQYGNLKEYYLKTLPTLPGFKGENGVNQAERYKRIANVLTSKTALVYMSFIVYMCQDFKEFVVPLQSTKLKIHLLYAKCATLVKDLLSRYVKNDSFMKQTELLPKEEIIHAINQEEKCQVYHLYFCITDTLLILKIHQYLNFNFGNRLNF